MKNKKHRSKAAWAALTGKWVFLAVMILFTLYPIIYTVLGSFKTNAELTQGGSFLPGQWHFENYYQAFVQADFTKYTMNSVIVSMSVTILAVVTCSLSGFILARRDCPLYVHDVCLLRFCDPVPDLRAFKGCKAE